MVSSVTLNTLPTIPPVVTTSSATSKVVEHFLHLLATLLFGSYDKEVEYNYHKRKGDKHCENAHYIVSTCGVAVAGCPLDNNVSNSVILYSFSFSVRYSLLRYSLIIP